MYGPESHQHEETQWPADEQDPEVEGPQAESQTTGWSQGILPAQAGELQARQVWDKGAGAGKDPSLSQAQLAMSVGSKRQNRAVSGPGIQAQPKAGGGHP